MVEDSDVEAVVVLQDVSVKEAQEDGEFEMEEGWDLI